MRYYAIEYAYGSTVVNNGSQPDKYISFESEKHRDEWVSEGSAFVGPGEREAVSKLPKGTTATPYEKTDEHYTKNYGVA